MVRSTTLEAGYPGSNTALGKQWSRDYPIDALATPTLLDANLRYQEALDWRKLECPLNGQKEDAVPSFVRADRAVMLLVKITVFYKSAKPELHGASDLAAAGPGASRCSPSRSSRTLAVASARLRPLSRRGALAVPA